MLQMKTSTLRLLYPTPWRLEIGSISSFHGFVVEFSLFNQLANKVLSFQMCGRCCVGDTGWLDWCRFLGKEEASLG